MVAIKAVIGEGNNRRRIFFDSEKLRKLLDMETINQSRIKQSTVQQEFPVSDFLKDFKYNVLGLAGGRLPGGLEQTDLDLNKILQASFSLLPDDKKTDLQAKLKARIDAKDTVGGTERDKNEIYLQQKQAGYKRKTVRVLSHLILSELRPFILDKTNIEDAIKKVKSDEGNEVPVNVKVKLRHLFNLLETLIQDDMKSVKDVLEERLDNRSIFDYENVGYEKRLNPNETPSDEFSQKVIEQVNKYLNGEVEKLEKLQVAGLIDNLLLALKDKIPSQSGGLKERVSHAISDLEKDKKGDNLDKDLKALLATTKRRICDLTGSTSASLTIEGRVNEFEKLSKSLTTKGITDTQSLTSTLVLNNEAAKLYFIDANGKYSEIKHKVALGNLINRLIDDKKIEGEKLTVKNDSVKEKGKDLDINALVERLRKANLLSPEESLQYKSTSEESVIVVQKYSQVVQGDDIGVSFKIDVSELGIKELKVEDLEVNSLKVKGLKVVDLRSTNDSRNILLEPTSDEGKYKLSIPDGLCQPWQKTKIPLEAIDGEGRKIRFFIVVDKSPNYTIKSGDVIYNETGMEFSIPASRFRNDAKFNDIDHEGIKTTLVKDEGEKFKELKVNVLAEKKAGPHSFILTDKKTNETYLIVFNIKNPTTATLAPAVGTAPLAAAAEPTPVAEPVPVVVAPSINTGVKHEIIINESIIVHPNTDQEILIRAGQFPENSNPQSCTGDKITAESIIENEKFKALKLTISKDIQSGQASITVADKDSQNSYDIKLNIVKEANSKVEDKAPPSNENSTPKKPSFFSWSNLAPIGSMILGGFSILGAFIFAKGEGLGKIFLGLIGGVLVSIGIASSAPKAFPTLCGRGDNVEVKK